MARSGLRRVSSSCSTRAAKASPVQTTTARVKERLFSCGTRGSRERARRRRSPSLTSPPSRRSRPCVTRRSAPARSWRSEERPSFSAAVEHTRRSAPSTGRGRTSCGGSPSPAPPAAARAGGRARRGGRGSLAGGRASSTDPAGRRCGASGDRHTAPSAPTARHARRREQPGRRRRWRGGGAARAGGRGTRQRTAARAAAWEAAARVAAAAGASSGAARKRRTAAPPSRSRRASTAAARRRSGG